MTLQVEVAGAPPLTTGMLVVFAVAALAFALFVTESLSPDVTALGVVAALVLLEPWTGITPAEGVSGFSNPATVTVLMMLTLSAGVVRSGAVQRLGGWMAAYAGTDRRRQLLATLLVGGLPSGVLNNTPVVAMLIPVVSDVADRGGTSPSKLLIPLSYASMFGGMLTLIGTSTNLIASDVSRRLIGRPFSMFEFTALGALVFLTGAGYLLVVGHRLVPERVAPAAAPAGDPNGAPYRAELVVTEASPFVGDSVTEAAERLGVDVDVVSVTRASGRDRPSADPTLAPGDVVTLLAPRGTFSALVADGGLVPAPGDGADETPGTLVELVVPSWSSLVGETLASSGFRQRYDATVLAVRRGGSAFEGRLSRERLRSGDTLLVAASDRAVDRLGSARDLVLAAQPPNPDYREGKIPHAVGIVVGVVGLAALGVLDVLVASLLGVVAMVLAGVLRPHELYDDVEWKVIVLIAGLIPLGVAFENTGAADLLGALVAGSAEVLPVAGVLWLFYVATALLTAFVSNSASVIVMLPVAVDAATRIGADAFAFVLAVTFAASADFMTPVGYQTNLLVYGPGGYRFTDYTRVGAPLQALLSVVTVGGIVLLWGL